MLYIALTGGIGSGKTAVSNRFAALGVPVIDTDLIAHRLTRPGQATLQQIYQLFGSRVFSSEQVLDRVALRRLILGQPALRRQLEQLLHPQIEQAVIRRGQAIQAPLCLLVVPLLVETGWQQKTDRVLVIDAPVTLRRDRIKARSRLSDQEIEALFAVQADRQQRLDIADDVILNHRDLSFLYRQVTILHHQYLKLVTDK